MKKRSNEKRVPTKKDVFPLHLFVMMFIGVILMSGVHQGLLVFMGQQNWDGTLQIIVSIVYWVVMSVGLTVYTGWRIFRTYDVPMKAMAEASEKVASGDFSVYIPPRHTTDKFDYLDFMTMDFNKMVEELGSIETLRTDFFSNVSHEIKTPLAVIQSNAELLNSPTLTEEKQKECTQNILSATNRLSSLITNMLKLNKLEKQVIRPKPEEFDVCAQLCECALQFEDMWEKKNIEFEADLEDRAMIVADAGLLELVWTNLLSNALKFTPESGKISITQTSVKDHITVRITDTGCGMSEATMRHIFDKFYQGDTSHATEGNGLGLALVNRIVQLSEGTITVQSEIGKGSTFTVRLPISIYDTM